MGKHYHSLFTIAVWILSFSIGITGLVIAIVALTRTSSSSTDLRVNTQRDLSPLTAQETEALGVAAKQREVPSEIKETEKEVRKSLKIGKDAIKIREGVYNIGTHMHPSGKMVETIVFTDTQFGGASKSEMITDPTSLACCEFLANGIRWPGMYTNIIMDPENLDGLTVDFFNTSINAVVTQYNDAAPRQIIGSHSFSSLIISNPGNSNGQNEVYFSVIEDANVIAHAIIHLVPSTRDIVECDVAFNTLFQFGNAAMNPNLIDWESVWAHELGHCVGLAHNNCLDSTMYPSAGVGETNKRTLSVEDDECVNALYSSELPPSEGARIEAKVLFAVVFILFSFL